MPFESQRDDLPGREPKRPGASGDRSQGPNQSPEQGPGKRLDQTRGSPLGDLRIGPARITRADTSTPFSVPDAAIFASAFEAVTTRRLGAGLGYVEAVSANRFAGPLRDHFCSDLARSNANFCRGRLQLLQRDTVWPEGIRAVRSATEGTVRVGALFDPRHMPNYGDDERGLLFDGERIYSLPQGETRVVVFAQVSDPEAERIRFSGCAYVVLYSDAAFNSELQMVRDKILKEGASAEPELWKARSVIMCNLIDQAERHYAAVHEESPPEGQVRLVPSDEFSMGVSVGRGQKIVQLFARNKPLNGLICYFSSHSGEIRLPDQDTEEDVN